MPADEVEMSPGTVIRHSDKVVYRSIGDDGVLLHVESGQYHEINAVGCRIWELCADNSVANVVSALQREYPDAPAQLEDEVVGFLRDLHARALIDFTEGDVESGD